MNTGNISLFYCLPGNKMINNFVSIAQTGSGYVILTFKTFCYKYETILLLIITAPFYPQSISFSCVCVVMVSPMS